MLMVLYPGELSEEGRAGDKHIWGRDSGRVLLASTGSGPQHLWARHSLG